MLGTPRAKPAQWPDQFFTGPSQRICDLRRRRVGDFAFNDSVRLHLPQFGSQHFVANSWQQVAQRRETPSAETQMPDRHDFPLSTDHINRRLHRTSKMISHRSSTAYKIVRTSSPPFTVISFCRIGSAENATERHGAVAISKSTASIQRGKAK